MATMVIAYYFIEVLTHEKLAFPGLSKTKWPFIITSIVISPFYIFVIGYFGSSYSTVPLIEASNYLLASFDCMIALFLVVCGIRVVVSLNKFKSPAVPRITTLVFFSAVGIFMFALPSFYLGSRTTSDWTWQSNLACWIVADLGLSLTSWSQVLTFRDPHKLGTSSVQSKVKSENHVTEMLDKSVALDLN